MTMLSDRGGVKREPHMGRTFFTLAMVASDARISHMKTASVRDLRYRFGEVEARLREGEEIQIRKRKRIIGRLLRVRPRPAEWPNFRAMLKEIYGDKVLKVSGAELLRWERDRY